MDKKALRDIQIKIGVVKRLAKEKTYYEKESVSEKDRLDKFKAEGKDEHTCRKQEEVWQESLMMIPDCQRKLTVAWDDLTSLVNSSADLKESEEYGNAVKMLEDTKAEAQR